MSNKLLDTNIIIYLSKKNIEFDKVAEPNDKLYISVITYIKVLRYRFTNKHEKLFIEELCRYLSVIELEKRIVEKVIQIRQLNKIKLPDAIILSTALVNNLELITANTADFSNIDSNLIVSNPMIK